MLNSNFVVIGIGRAFNASSRYRWYWTTDFGGFDDSGPDTLTPQVTITNPTAGQTVSGTVNVGADAVDR